MAMGKYNLVFATITIGLVLGPIANAAENETEIEKGKPPKLPPCPKDCPYGVYKCQEIKVDLLLLAELTKTHQLPIGVKLHDIIYVNCELPDGKPIPKDAIDNEEDVDAVEVDETDVKGGPKPPPPCSSKCPPWKYVCCKNKLIVLKIAIGPIGPIPKIKNLIILCKGLNIDVGGYF